LAKISNASLIKGHLEDILNDGDVFIGVSVANALKK
jgi:hypothetical protein